MKTGGTPMTKRTGSDMELSPLCIGALEGTGTLFDPQRWGKNVKKKPSGSEWIKDSNS